jgi:hypothetical protein
MVQAPRLSSSEILSVESYRKPPAEFVKQLERFDPDLRVVWGLGQAAPFPGWVIERRIPGEMRAKFYENKPRGRERYAAQVVVENGKVVGYRRFDMQPDYWPVYRVMNAEGEPISELGEFVIDYLRIHYKRTLLGFPELSEKFHKEDLAEKEAAEVVGHDKFLDDTSRKVLEHRTEVWPEYFAHGGQPKQLKEGTEVYGSSDDTGTRQGIIGEGSESPTVN